MGTLIVRHNKNGSIAYRVMIRRKDIPNLFLTFDSWEEATNWINENEYKYITDPDIYQKWIKRERLRLKRKREFNIK
jgi:hypothetical protein